MLFHVGSAHAATVYYLHGKIVEDKGDNAVHPTYGTYRYSEIVAQLKRGGHRVRSEIRPAATDPVSYAKRLSREILREISGGLPPEEIVVVGFSKGAQIAILISQNLALPEVRFIFQAVCGDWIERFPDLKVYGNVLSLYETSDTAGSCSALFS